MKQNDLLDTKLFINVSKFINNKEKLEMAKVHYIKLMFEYYYYSNRHMFSSQDP